jgi:hypothetical protein
MALAELIPRSKRLVIAFQEIEIVEPFGKTLQFLFDGLLALSNP